MRKKSNQSEGTPAVAVPMGLLAIACIGLFSGCDQPQKPKDSISNTGRFGSEPATSWDGNIWCNRDGHEDFYAQDKSGQVFELVQCRTNSNLYVVWRAMGETNGIR
jgi:hypothetical protein